MTVDLWLREHFNLSVFTQIFRAALVQWSKLKSNLGKTEGGLSVLEKSHPHTVWIEDISVFWYVYKTLNSSNNAAASFSLAVGWLGEVGRRVMKHQKTGESERDAHPPQSHVCLPEYQLPQKRLFSKGKNQQIIIIIIFIMP